MEEAGSAIGHGIKDGTRETKGGISMGKEGYKKYHEESQTNLKENQVAMYAPFGPTIFQARWPAPFIQYMNEWMDTVVADPDLRKSYDHSSKLAGNLRHEMRMEEDMWKYKPPSEKFNMGEWLGHLVNNYIKKVSTGLSSGAKAAKGDVEMKEFNIIDGWINDQYAGDFNPLHKHGGDISSVTFLKVPESIVNGTEKDEAGYLLFSDGRFQKYCAMNFVQPPAVGMVYIFPHWLVHTVYPFRGEGVRRSMSFNAKVITNHADWN